MSPNSIYFIVSSVFAIVIGLDIFNWAKGKKFLPPELRLQHLRKKIDSTIIILGTTSLAASVLFHVNLFDYRAPIEHGDVGSITLKDFRGFKRPDQTLDGSKEFAFIVTSIEWDVQEQKVEVAALFHPSRSYVFNENLVNKFLLEHELYHFHITELYARKIRRQLADFTQVPEAAQIKTIVEEQLTEEHKMQMEYDYDTYHSYVLKKQKAWQSKIDSLLSSHRKFDQPIVQFPLTP